MEGMASSKRNAQDTKKHRGGESSNKMFVSGVDDKFED